MSKEPISNRVFHLLLVDDDVLIQQALKLSLPPEWKLYSVQDPQHVPYEKFFNAAFVDMHLYGDLSNPAGLKVIEKLARHQPQLELVAISGDLNRSLMEQCLKVGARQLWQNLWPSKKFELFSIRLPPFGIFG